MINQDLMRQLGRWRPGDEIKVMFNGVYVPLTSAIYDPSAQVIVLWPDEASDDYRIAVVRDDRPTSVDDPDWHAKTAEPGQ